MPHIEEVVPAALAGERLDRVVAMVSGLTRSAARDLVEAGGVTVDGSVVTRAADRVDEGATLAFDAARAQRPERRGARPDRCRCRWCTRTPR